MDIRLVGDRIGEVKALFVLAQRILPFMEDLFKFVSEVTPILEDVNKEIQDNLSKMPNASKQLAKVTEANEMATTEIMDTVDRLTNELISIVSELDKLKEIDRNRIVNPINLLKTISETISKEKELKSFLPEINDFIDRMENAVTNEHTEIIDDISNRLSAIVDDANTIIMSLQVQDITSQQLAAVNNLIEHIQSRLAIIMSNLTNQEDGKRKDAGKTKDINDYDEKIKVSHLHRNIAFDPDAIDAIDNKHSRQNTVDDILKRNAVVDNSTEEQDTESSSSVEGNSSEEFTQDDIDALFGGVK
ncbi:MAG: hypothetical protein GX372_08550 [Ignavibacteria bacterium]|jgi:chemotaxis regulatin CheY-phosphate phosphatase CheZ|nr:hypothetical protein [Ignavibacteria bacterium]